MWEFRVFGQTLPGTGFWEKFVWKIWPPYLFERYVYLGEVFFLRKLRGQRIFDKKGGEDYSRFFFKNPTLVFLEKNKGRTFFERKNTEVSTHRLRKKNSRRRIFFSWKNFTSFFKFEKISPPFFFEKYLGQIFGKINQIKVFAPLLKVEKNTYPA